jgi:hypothetical protein
MNEGPIFLILGLVVIGVLWTLERRRKQENPQHRVTASHLAEIVRSAEVANNGFFRSLELVQKNLEALIARAETAEQRLKSLMLHPGIEKREQYTAAALLLAEGHDAERVSSMLGLPEPQVQLIRELQQVTGKDKRTGRVKKFEESTIKDSARQSKIAASREKNAAPPILLVDVLKSSAAENSAKKELLGRFRGVTV